MFHILPRVKKTPFFSSIGGAKLVFRLGAGEAESGKHQVIRGVYDSKFLERWGILDLAATAEEKLGRKVCRGRASH